MTTEENNPEGNRVVVMLEIIKDLCTDLRIRDVEMEDRMTARDTHFEIMLKTLTSSQEKLGTSLVVRPFKLCSRH